MDDTLSNGKILVRSNDVSIDTKVNNWVILVITWVLLLVLVLVASAGVADWVRFKMNISSVLKSYCLTEGLLGVVLIMEGNFNVVVLTEVRNGIVNWMWLSLWFQSNPLVTESLLLTLSVVKSSFNISVFSEVRDKVVLSITNWSWLERSMELVSSSSLGVGHVLVGDHDVSFGITEIWSSDIFWTWGLLEGGGIVLNTESLLLTSDVLLGGDNILINSEVWYEIVVLELNLWLFWWGLVPWSSTSSIWSELNVRIIVWYHSDGSDFFTQEKGENH